MVRIKVLKIYKLKIYKILNFMFKIKSSFAKNQLVNSQTKISSSSSRTKTVWTAKLALTDE